MMVLITMLLSLSGLGVLGTDGTVGTHRTVLRAEPMVLLAVHRVLASSVQAVIAPVKHSALHLAAGTAVRSVTNVMALHLTHALSNAPHRHSSV